MREQWFFRRLKMAVRFLFGASLAGSLLLSAADHPSFIGTWVMDADKSDFGMLPKVAEIRDRITQTGPDLVINRTRDGKEMVIDIPLDGSQKDNDILGNTMKTGSHWDTDVLIVDFTGLRNGRPISYKERWTLASDGKTIEVARHLTSPRGETDQTLLMVKQ
jgi:hypothetical protein